MRRRTVTVGGRVRRLTARDAMRFEVVRGVLMGTLTLDQGARRMRTTPDEVARLVDGARRAIIRELGEDALDSARVDA